MIVQRTTPTQISIDPGLFGNISEIIIGPSTSAQIFPAFSQPRQEMQICSPMIYVDLTPNNIPFGKYFL